MAKHILKEDPENFQSLWDAQRSVEIRFDDRFFEALDDLIIAETRYSSQDMKAGKPLEFTGRAVKAEVVEVERNAHGIKDGWCVLIIGLDDFTVAFNPDNPWAEWIDPII